MTRRFIPVSESFEKWRKAPDYRAADEALEGELALVRARAGRTQQEVAQRVAFAESAARGLGVQELSEDSPASREIVALVNELLESAV